MEWTDTECYAAAKSRDARFDGRLFLCVKSTGIFCRTVCPANMPKPENCIFVPSAAAALDAGFRPCHRCRPETAPGSPAWNGTAATVSRAMRLLGDTGDDISLPNLADKLGVGDRHLRRLFIEHLGAPPRAILSAERLQTARQLLATSTLSITEIAFASGYNSIRRFNDAILKTYGMSPKALRAKLHKDGVAADGAALTLMIGYRSPASWTPLFNYLAMRAIRGMEQVDVDALTYSRTFQHGDAGGVLTVRVNEKRSRIELSIDATSNINVAPVIRRVRDLMDTDAMPEAVDAALSKEPSLAPRVAAHPGLRVPGCYDPFELALRAIIGQQISVKGAITILTRLVERHGNPIRDLGDFTGLFPTPDAIAAGDLSGLGLTGRRIETLQTVATAFADDPDFLSAASDPIEARDRLLALKGIGPWTAEYVALRALKDPDAFPASDLVLVKNAGAESPKALEKASQAWRPWRAYAAQHLWTS